MSSLAENAAHPWKPPGGGFQGALSHDVIHGLDITVGLGLDRRVPDERLRTVLEGVKPKQVKYFGTDLHGVRLPATDLDWSYGAGTPVTGAAQDAGALRPDTAAGPATRRAEPPIHHQLAEVVVPGPRAVGLRVARGCNGVA